MVNTKQIGIYDTRVHNVNRQYSLTQKFYSRTIQFDHKLKRPSRWKQTYRLRRVTNVIGPLRLIPRCVPAVQIMDSSRNPLRGTSHTCKTQNSHQSGKWEGLTVYSNMGEGCTRNRPPPAERVFLHVDEWRHTMEWHGGQTSHRRPRKGFWPLWEAEVQRPADVSRRVYVRRRRR